MILRGPSVSGDDDAAQPGGSGLAYEGLRARVLSYRVRDGVCHRPLHSVIFRLALPDDRRSSRQWPAPQPAVVVITLAGTVVG